ncbi:alkaline phosphatase family protein [Halobacterium zhouii]|uniref:alkaline phosphatase family protein n=1 Tax=Halobacterium zhouii TaxID=2902624 RepID=UPI001E48386E|nr:alkaline phosphatase family protein [Halobacterium zhouii]
MPDGVRTLVLGFDALDDRYLDRFEDVTPTLSRLRAEGVSAPLDSTHPPWTASAWPSMYTGTDPSHHGVYGFFTYDYPDDGRLVTRNDVDAPALWNYLSERGVRSTVLNVPVTHPAEPIEGALIPGYLGGEADAGHPEGIRDDLSAAIGEEYRIYSAGEVAEDSDEKLQGYLDLIDARKRAAVELLSDREWELAVVQVQKTDAVFHNFDDEAAFRAVYEAADDLAAATIDAVDGPVNVVVCSDHGMGRKEGYQIQLNDVLRRAGYVEATSDTGTVSIGAEKRRLMGAGEGTGAGTDEGDDSSSLLTGGVSAVEGALSRVGVTPGRVYALAAAVGIEDLLVDVIPDEVRQSAGEGVDWRASRAYCRSSSHLGVRINLEGREPSGTVPQAEYEQVRDDLISLLTDLETPDGEPAFESVLPREAVYDGPYVEDAPDVIVYPRNADHVLSTNLYGREFVPADVHDHDPTGVFIGHGPGFDHAATPDRLSLTDVAPTVMALLGHPVPQRMTGTAPRDALSVPTERADYGDVPFGTDRAVEDAREEVTDSLADLGYI